MHPLLHLGPWDVAAYTLFHVLGAVAAVTILVLLGRRRAMARADLVAVGAAAVLGVWLGARVLHAALDRQWYAGHPERLFSLHFTGFALYGGLVGGGAAAGWVAHRRGLAGWLLADVGAVAAGVGIAVVRVGCFLNGCCFGKETGLPWGVTYPAGSPAWARQAASGDVVGTVFGGATVEAVPVHPTQLYELVAALVAAFLAWWLPRRGAPAGLGFLAAAAWFSAFRLLNWQLRVHAGTFDAPAWFYTAMYPAAVMLFGALAVTRFADRR